MDRFSRRNRQIALGVLIVTIAAAVIVPIYVASTMSDTPEGHGELGDSFNTTTPRPTEPIPPGQEGDDPGVQAGVNSPRQNNPRNCSFALAYWKERPDAWPIEGLQIRSLTLDKDEAIALVLNNPADARAAVLQQLVVYTLNTQRGSDPEAVLETVRDVSVWIEAYNGLETIPGEALDQARVLANVLLQYNIGLIGPGPCPEITDTPTPQPTNTPTATATTTATPSATSTLPPPPAIPTNTSGPPPGNPQPTQPPPPQPPTQAPTQPPPPPTEVPTQPPPPPTAPPPTQPPPTPVPPDPPTPTSPP